MSNAFSISFRLHDIDTNAHDFYNWAKKEEENSTIKFLFLSVDDYERSFSFLSEACKLWVRNTSCFCQNYFGHLSSLKQHTMVGEWLI